MAGADTKNAHVRRETKRQSVEVERSEAQRALEDPAIQRGFDTVRDRLVAELVELKHDGQPETDAFEREVCRCLRTLQSVRRLLSIAVQTGKLESAQIADISQRGRK